MYFWNLSKASLNDNYPLSKMDHILQEVVGSFHTSMMDSFLRYNQVEVLLEDQRKTSFTTPWGTFMYAWIPFGLINVGATFQLVMDISFIWEQDKFLVIYLENITIISKGDAEHI